MEHENGPARRWLTLEPLNAGSFAAFGSVIEAGSAATHYPINAGDAERFHDLARIDTGRDSGRPVLSLFRARPQTLPLSLRLVERHRLGSQTFLPLAGQRFVVVVAPPGPPPAAEQLRGFLATAGQGVHYAAGTWHHPLIALDAGGDFAVIDRGGPGGLDDCEEHPLAAGGLWVRDG